MIYNINNGDENKERQLALISSKLTKESLNRFSIENLTEITNESLDLFLTEHNPAVLELTRGASSQLSYILGNKKEFISFIYSNNEKIDVALDWYYDKDMEQIELSEKTIEELIKSIDTPEFLKEKDYYVKKGLQYFQQSYANPKYISYSIRFLKEAERVISGKSHDPTLYYYLGLISFYYDVNLKKASKYFEDSILHADVEGEKMISVKSSYELAKINYILNNFEKSIYYSELVFTERSNIRGKSNKTKEKSNELKEKSLIIYVKSLIALNMEPSDFEQTINDIVCGRNLNLLKIVYDDDLRKNDFVIKSLISERSKYKNQVQEELNTIHEKWNQTFEKGLFLKELASVKEEIGKNTISSFFIATNMIKDLDKKIQQLKQENEHAINNHLKTLADLYKKVWSNNDKLVSFIGFVEEKKARIGQNELFTLEDLAYDFDSLSKETHSIELMIKNKIKNKEIQWKFKFDIIEKINTPISENQLLDKIKLYLKNKNIIYAESMIFRKSEFDRISNFYFLAFGTSICLYLIYKAQKGDWTILFCIFIGFVSVYLCIPIAMIMRYFTGVLQFLFWRTFDKYR